MISFLGFGRFDSSPFPSDFQKQTQRAEAEEMEEDPCFEEVFRQDTENLLMDGVHRIQAVLPLEASNMG